MKHKQASDASQKAELTKAKGNAAMDVELRVPGDRLWVSVGLDVSPCRFVACTDVSRRMQ